MTKIISDWLVIISANYCEDCEYLVEAEYRSFVASKRLKAHDQYYNNDELLAPS